MKNSTEVTEFILAGLTDDPELQIPLFIVFLLIYLSTLLGNLGMVGLILLDSHLHTPMYLFLSHLSLVDFGYSSAVTPKVMAGLLSIDKTISHNACGTQFFFFVGFITTESFLLAAMAYDRYAAVCKPLHYTTTMTTNTCACLIIGSYVCGFLNSSVHTGNIFRLSFCKFNVIDHFFCDAPPLLALSCSDTSLSETVIFFVVGFNALFSIVVIVISYLFIFITILRMHSSEGRQKAFSTCVSHLTAVSIFYGTVIFMYLQPSSSHTMGTDKMASVFYTMIIPMLNPLVYSLRNKDVKGAFKKAVVNAKSTITFIF
ncbi:rCG48163 [Rattus norvegicus]|uniref:Olfactory receptor n=2 Tax=Rattus norvegicus TaxID=10116 RepID=A6I0F5_RAT|nr:olfactory receptor Olr343 [Rattus norvegicus]EDM12936.1 rCG48163 [Rattus norvegicus]|eukprot:NP_001000254.1 olfactory receptor Olr343 [Rattus norvegicus]